MSEPTDESPAPSAQAPLPPTAALGEDPEEDPEELRLLEHHHQLLRQEQTLPQSGTSLPPVTSSLLPAAGPPSQSGPAHTDDAPAMELEEQEEDVSTLVCYCF